MGKKGGWISSVKKALTFESKDTKEKKSEKSKNESYKKNEIPENAVPLAIITPLEKTEENEQNMPRAYSVAIATAAAAEAAAVVARAAAAEVARLTAIVIRPEEVAAVKIQTAFRAHLARRALRALRGLARLKSMIQGQSVQRQSMIALKCMQTLTRVQSQILSRRVKISDENLALQKHIQQKCEREIEKLNAPVITTNENQALQQQYHQQKCVKEVDKLRTPTSTTNGVGDWNASAASKEQIEAKIQHKEEAALRRERALAYAHSHQTVRKNPSKSENPKPTNPIFTDQLTDPFWGWSWLDQWLGTRPWETKPTQDCHVITDHENATQKSNLKTKPPPSTPAPRARSVGPKTMPMGPKGSIGPSKAQPEHQRRHTIGGTLVKDGDKMESVKTVSSKVTKSRVASRLGNGKTDKGSFGSAKKQLSHSLSSSGPRRHSGPAKGDA